MDLCRGVEGIASRLGTQRCKKGVKSLRTTEIKVSKGLKIAQRLIIHSIAQRQALELFLTSCKYAEMVVDDSRFLLITEQRA